MIHIRRPWKWSNFQDPPHPLSIYVQIFSTLLTLDVQFQMNLLPPLQMKANRLKENIIQEWLLHIITSFLQIGFRSQYQLINLVCFSFDFFLFSWSLTICFLCGFTFLRVQLSKNITKYLLFTIIHIFSIHFPISLFYLHNLKTWINYRTTTAPFM